jgi:hypothetical protein
MESSLSQCLPITVHTVHTVTYSTLNFIRGEQNGAFNVSVREEHKQNYIILYWFHEGLLGMTEHFEFARRTACHVLPVPKQVEEHRLKKTLEWYVQRIRAGSTQAKLYNIMLVSRLLGMTEHFEFAQRTACHHGHGVLPVPKQVEEQRLQKTFIPQYHTCSLHIERA